MDSLTRKAMALGFLDDDTVDATYDDDPAGLTDADDEDEDEDEDDEFRFEHEEEEEEEDLDQDYDDLNDEDEPAGEDYEQGHLGEDDD